MNSQPIHDHGENDPIEFELTPAERDNAAFAQAQLRLDAMARNAADASKQVTEEGYSK